APRLERLRAEPPQLVGAAVRARLAALDLRDALLEIVEPTIGIAPVLVERGLQLVDRVVDRGDQAVGLANVGAQRVAVRTEIGAVALEDPRGLLEPGLELVDLNIELLLFGVDAALQRGDVLAHGLALALGRGPEASARAQRGGKQGSSQRHLNSTRRSLSSPRPVGSVSPLGTTCIFAG